MSIGSRGRRWLIAFREKKKRKEKKKTEEEIERNDERKVSKQDVNIYLISYMIRWKKFGWLFGSNFFFFFNRGIRYFGKIYFSFKNLKSREEIFITVFWLRTRRILSNIKYLKSNIEARNVIYIRQSGNWELKLNFDCDYKTRLRRPI